MFVSRGSRVVPYGHWLRSKPLYGLPDAAFRQRREPEQVFVRGHLPQKIRPGPSQLHLVSFGSRGDVRIAEPHIGVHAGGFPQYRCPIAKVMVQGFHESAAAQRVRSPHWPYVTYHETIMKTYTPTHRTKVRRLAKRAVYDKDRVHEILDEAFLCHVGFSVDDHPYVIPTLYARSNETVYIHGSGASRMLKTLAQGVEMCLTVTIVDGYVLARSAFHHSMNYRSVAILGRARLVSELPEKLEALRLITDHMVPHRWDEARQPNEHELKQTAVLALPLEEVSAKVRVGPPIDDDEDYALPVWAGVIPVRTQLGEPISDGRVLPDVQPVQLSRFARKTPKAVGG
jgi:nitroimidazol reductase NimA-like FMN-containing flavoprotein (pyridoxamine 5'-phosphate oxidase superfamily)